MIRLTRAYKIIPILPIGTIFIGAAFLSCNNASTKNGNVQSNSNDTIIRNADTNTKYTKDMDTYREKMGDTISAINRRINQLNEEIKKEGKEAKKGYEKTIADLDQKGKELKSKLDDYQAIGKEKWEKFKTDFSHDIDTLSKQVKDLAARKNK